jgi:hypothetical protein
MKEFLLRRNYAKLQRQRPSVQLVGKPKTTTALAPVSRSVKALYGSDLLLPSILFLEPIRITSFCYAAAHETNKEETAAGRGE